MATTANSLLPRVPSPFQGQPLTAGCYARLEIADEVFDIDGLKRKWGNHRKSLLLLVWIRVAHDSQENGRTIIHGGIDGGLGVLGHRPRGDTIPRWSFNREFYVNASRIVKYELCELDTH
jgi:hypothetical protein